MVKYSKWLGLLAAVVLAISCFLPWIMIPTKDTITVTGMDAAGTNYGRPGYLHFIFAGLFLVFHFIPKVWAKRANLAVAAINLAWAMRNYFMLSSCMAGVCPVRQPALHAVLIASFALLLAALFPDIKLPAKEKS